MDPLPQDAKTVLQNTWKHSFGELVPLTDEELLYWTLNMYQAQNNLPITIWTIQPTGLIAMFLPNRPLPLADPTALPAIEIPSSTFCFFKKEWAKRGRMVSLSGSNKRDHNGNKKEDPHALIWRTLTDLQKKMWTALFYYRRMQAEGLIQLGHCSRAPSFNEMKKAERMKKE